MSKKKHAARVAAVEKTAAKNRPEKELKAALKSKIAFGQSKHADKLAGVDTTEKIYSHSTYQNYMKEGELFLKWVRERNPDLPDLAHAEKYAKRYIKSQIDKGMSPSTIKKRASALGKIFGKSYLLEMRTPARRRVEISRSRDLSDKAASFDQSKKNDGLKELMRGTGLRRHELAALKLSQFSFDIDENRWYVEDVKGKGGRVRSAPIYGDAGKILAEARARADESGRVFPQGKVPANADVHLYRADYAARVYQEHARDVATLPRAERYDCRADLGGVHYDRSALEKASIALGHSRVEIVARNYLHTM